MSDDEKHNNWMKHRVQCVEGFAYGDLCHIPRHALGYCTADSHDQDVFAVMFDTPLVPGRQSSLNGSRLSISGVSALNESPASRRCPRPSRSLWKSVWLSSFQPETRKCFF